MFSIHPYHSLIAKKSKKFLCCGRRTLFDYDDSGSIIYTSQDVGEGNEDQEEDTSGDDESDSDEEEQAKAATQPKATEKEKEKIVKTISTKDKAVLKHNEKAKALSTGSAEAVAADAARPQGGGARRGRS